MENAEREAGHRTLQAQFYNPIRRTLKNAAILSMQKIWNTVIIFFWNIFPLLLVYVIVKLTKSFELVVRMTPIWALVVPGVLAVLCAKRFVKIFDPYLNPQKEEEETEEEEA